MRKTFFKNKRRLIIPMDEICVPGASLTVHGVQFPTLFEGIRFNVKDRILHFQVNVPTFRRNDR